MTFPDQSNELTLLFKLVTNFVSYSEPVLNELLFGRLNIPTHMLPQTSHPTAFSIIKSDNPTVLNVLVDVVNFAISWYFRQLFY